MSQITSTVELFEQSREGSVDSRVGTMTRRFLVPTTRDQAATYPGVPTVGSSFVFGGKTVLCDRIDVRGTGDPNISEIVAAYSNDGRFQFSTVDKRTDETYARWSMSDTIQTRKVPSFVKRAIESKDSSGNPILVDSWERDDLQVECTMTTFSSTVILSVFNNSTINAIHSQVGRIHKFGSFTNTAGEPYQALWKYRGARVSNTAKDKFEVTHDWYSDGGNYAFETDSAVSPNLGFIALGVPRLVPIVGRKQFEEYLIIPPQTVGGLPDVAIYNPYASIMTPALMSSYTSLPGNPI